MAPLPSSDTFSSSPLTFQELNTRALFSLQQAYTPWFRSWLCGMETTLVVVSSVELPLPCKSVLATAVVSSLPSCKFGRKSPTATPSSCVTGCEQTANRGFFSQLPKTGQTPLLHRPRRHLGVRLSNPLPCARQTSKYHRLLTRFYPF